MPLTGSPATPLTYESLSFEAYKVLPLVTQSLPSQQPSPRC